MKKKLAAEITVAENRQKLQISGEMDLPKTREVNSTLINLGFAETYPIGCRRFYADLQVNSETAQAILQGFGFRVRLKTIKGKLL